MTGLYENSAGRARAVDIVKEELVVHDLGCWSTFQEFAPGLKLLLLDLAFQRMRRVAQRVAE